MIYHTDKIGYDKEKYPEKAIIYRKQFASTCKSTH